MLKVFSVRDVKGDSFGNLITVETAGSAMRAFYKACVTQGSDLFDYPEDFSLYELGTFEPNSGKLVGRDAPEFVISAVSVVQKLRKSESVVEVKQ